MVDESESSDVAPDASKKPPSILFTQIILGLCAFGALIGSGILATPTLTARHPIIFLFYAVLGGLPIWLIIQMNARRKWTRWATICYLPVAAIMFPFLLVSGIETGMFPPITPGPGSAGAALFEKVRFFGLLILALALALEPRAKRFLNKPAKVLPVEASPQSRDSSGVS
jgi:hypothetical protein